MTHPRKHSHLAEWSFLVPMLLIPVGLALFALCFTLYHTHPPIDGDGQGYYAYLPSYLIDHDPTFRHVLMTDILPRYAAVGHPGPRWFGFTLQPTGAWLDKYGVGVAMLESPFFAAGHFLAAAAGKNADGYSGIEEYAVALSAVAYLVLGLFALRAVLRRWFDDVPVAVTLAAVALGTGVLVYASWAPSVSHAFSFFAVSLMLLCTLRWYERPGSWIRAALLGVSMGLVVAIRLPNAELLVVVPLLGVGSMAAARARLVMLRRNLLQVGVAILCAALMLVPQVVTWWFATGHLITRPYPGESFNFAHPKLWQALADFRPHGLLPYYPVLGLALIGAGWAWFRRRDIAVPVTIAFLGFWYLVAAWWDWSYTNAFGDRAFIDIAPILALPLAVLTASLKVKWLRAGAYVVIGASVAVTCMLMIAYFQRRLPEAGIDPGGYAQILVHPAQLLHAPVRPHEVH